MQPILHSYLWSAVVGLLLPFEAPGLDLGNVQFSVTYSPSGRLGLFWDQAEKTQEGEGK